MKRGWTRGAVAGLVALVALGVAPASGADVEVTYAGVPSYETERATWALAKGLVTVEGLKVTPKYMFPDMYNKLLVNGDVETGGMSVAAYILAKAKGAPLEALVSEVKIGNVSTHMFARDEIKSAADLKGKKIGVSSLSDAQTVYHRGILRERHGIGTEQATWIPKAPPILLQLLAKGEIDAAVLFSPFSGEAKKTPGIRELYSQGTVWKEMTGDWPIQTLIVVQRRILDQHPDVAKKLVTALRRSQRYGVEHDREFAIEYARGKGLKDPALIPRVDLFLDYTMTASERQTLTRVLDWTVKGGVMDKPMTLDAILSEKYRDARE